jgi:DNA processing protein
MAANDSDELAAWLRLLNVPGAGRQQLRRVLAEYGSPQAVLAAPKTHWRQYFGEAGAAALESEDERLQAERDRAQAWLAESADRHWLALGDPRYPDALLQTADPPLLLYLQGRVELLRTRCIAIVGSRNPTAQGADNARSFAEHLGRAGYTIVSGMALGIDAAAHVGALAAGHGTIAVVGTGLDRVYPRGNRDLAHRIVESGLLVSEFPFGTPPLQPNFPQRNRIIAGLSLGTLVVEAALQSGSLITAAQAADANREVFAIPGSIHSPQSRGCHALIKQGAKLVETAQDVIDELEGLFAAVPPAAPAPASEPALSNDLDPVLRAMGYEPIGLDALLARTGLATGALSARLLELELAGQVARLPGGTYQRRASG